MLLLAQLRARRAAVQGDIDALLAKVETEKRTTLSADEDTKFGELRKERDELDQRIEQLVDEEDRRAKDADAAQRAGAVTDERGQPRAHITHEPKVYDRGAGQSYFRDLAAAHLQGDGDAFARLQRHAKELDVDMPAREARRRQLAEQQVDNRHLRGTIFEKETRVNPNRTDGQGGYFVPPLWLVDEYVPLARAGRPFANSVRNLDLPGGTDSINVPKVATGTATGVQTADAGTVTSTDLTDTFVNAPVRTIAGQQDVAMQLIDQSPVSFDEIVMQDLLADYNLRLDLQMWQGSGAAGQLKGVDNTGSVNSVTYTDASPTVPELYLPLAQAQSQVGGNRFLPATAFFMHGRRWFWMVSALDSQNRPLVEPIADVAFNPAALQLGVNVEGPVGTTQGLPIIADWNITTTDNTNQDRVYAIRTSDLYLWEGSPRTRVLQEVLSGTLQVRIQLYNYVAFMPDRYPKSIAIISGTGLAAPSGF